MKALNHKATKSFWGILATATGVASTFIATLGTPASALATESVFNCSAKGVIVEVSRLNNGILRYSAYNIPTNLERPDLVVDGGTARRDKDGYTVYRFNNKNYLYAVVQDSGYGKVLVYKNNRLIATNYCGDV